LWTGGILERTEGKNKLSLGYLFRWLDAGGPYILGLNAEALRPRFGRLSADKPLLISGSSGVTHASSYRHIVALPSPEIEWEFVEFDERGRDGGKVAIPQGSCQTQPLSSPDGLRSFPVKATVQT
jgi:hypothetical protein